MAEVRLESLTSTQPLNTKKVPLYTIYINKIYTELNRSSNGLSIILYFFKSIELLLITSKFLCFFFEYDYNSRIIYTKNLAKTEINTLIYNRNIFL
jgi:hypothetical protein